MYIINFDGGCFPNPGGKAVAGFTIRENGVLIHADSVEMIEEKTSNNVAEYGGLILALLHMKETNKTHERIVIKGDSNMVINQMFGSWRLSGKRGGIYLPYAERGRLLVEEFTNIEGTWIPREQNEIADRLTLPRRDLRRVDVLALVDQKISAATLFS